MFPQATHSSSAENNMSGIGEAATKCFLCYAEFQEDEKPCLLFEKWEYFQTDKGSRAEIVSCILDMEMDENKAHSKFLCGKCNEIILDYERMRIKLYDLRNKIVFDYKKTMQLVNNLDQMEVEKYEIDEEYSIAFINTKGTNDYDQQELPIKIEREADEIVKSSPTESTAIFHDADFKEYKPFNNMNDTERIETLANAEHTFGMSNRITGIRYSPTEFPGNNWLHARSDVNSDDTEQTETLGKPEHTGDYSQARSYSKNGMAMANKYKCCICGCREKELYDDIKLYRFPADKKIFEKWCHNIKLSTSVCRKVHRRLCSIHFEKQFVGKRKLISGAIPTLFLGHQDENIFLNPTLKKIHCFRKCCIKSCSNSNYKNITEGTPLYTFPKDKTLYKIWRDFCQLDNDCETKLLFVCAKHFKKDEMGKKKLIKGACPSN